MKYVIAIMSLMFALPSVAQKKKEIIEIKIQTSAVCNMCKERLEHDISYEKGVTYVSLDEDTKQLTIRFKKGKNTKEELKKAITKVGYDADELPADPKAYEKLPACCKKDVPPH